MNDVLKYAVHGDCFFVGYVAVPSRFACTVCMYHAVLVLRYQLDDGMSCEAVTTLFGHSQHVK